MQIRNLYQIAVQCAENELARRIPFQVMDQTSEDYGGVYDDAVGFCPDQAGCAVGLVEWGCWAYCCPDSSRFNDGELCDRILLAIAFQGRKLRPSGFVDLRERNYDSPPDTAFACVDLGKALWSIRRWRKADRLDELESAILPVYRTCIAALADHGGFHTPNHRWVIVGALSQAQELYPDWDLRPVIDTYLAEGIDLNDAGLYSEKSFHYSAEINNRLLDFYFAFREDWILEKICTNCNGIIDMMNSDSTLLTNISIRQDNGKKLYPVNFVNSFFAIGHLCGQKRMFSAIATLLNVCGLGNGMNDRLYSREKFDCAILVFLFARNPEWIDEVIEAEPLSENYEKLFSDVGIWKWKNGELSVTAMTEQIGVLSVQYGDISIPEIGMHAPYFTAQKYTCAGIAPLEDGRGVAMRLEPTYGAGQELLMPGYWKPLNRPVPFQDLPYHNLAERTRLPRPDVAYDWTIEKRENGFDMTVKSVGGMDHVYAEVEFTINLPGTLITETGYEPIQTSRPYHLTGGYLTYRIGTYAVTIGPGSYGNTNVQRVIPQDKNVLKVIVSDVLPMDHTFEIRCFRLDGMAPEAYHSVLR